MFVMLGDERRQVSGEAFHYFNVDELIPANHILRRIDAVLDLSWVREELRECYSDRGRPSWDPEVIVRMILLGYLYGYSEARLVDEVRMHMGYRWFCLLQPSDRIPDRTTLVKLRNERWQQDLWVKILEVTVQQCIEAGLVSGRHVSLDGTRIKADASIASLEPIEPPASLRDHLLEKCGWEKYVPEQEQPKPPDDDEPRPKSEPDFRGKQLKNDKVRSASDPDARLYRKQDGEGCKLSYLGHFCIDTKSTVVLAAQATKASTSGEWEAGARLIDEANARVGGRIRIVTADKGYGVRGFLDQVVQRGLTPHIPVQGQAATKAVPGRRALWSRLVDLEKGRRVLAACRRERARTTALKATRSTGYRISRLLRLRVEHCFGEAKTCHGMDRARYRGQPKVDTQVILTAAVMNLKRLVKALDRRQGSAIAVRCDVRAGGRLLPRFDHFLAWADKHLPPFHRLIPTPATTEV